MCWDIACQTPVVVNSARTSIHGLRRQEADAYGYLLLYHVPPTPPLFSYITKVRLGIFC